MTTQCLEHIEQAEPWLNRAKNRTGEEAKAADCLYEVIVYVTRAVMELEKEKCDEGD